MGAVRAGLVCGETGAWVYKSWSIVCVPGGQTGPGELGPLGANLVVG